MATQNHKRVVLSLGGNAFVQSDQSLTMATQFQFAREALFHLQPLVADEIQLLITHGNGPQVGHMLIRVEESLGKAYAVPLEVCVAESEGELGYVLEQTLYNLMSDWNIHRPLAGLLTQVLVDADDPAFEHPTKPIGPFYTREQSKELTQKGFHVIEDAGRGYRRVVASPQPKQIIETEVIELLLQSGVIVIAAGGGGIPVIKENGRLVGVEAVIDKDWATALLGEAIGAELMIVLTGIPCAYRNFNQPNQEPIGQITVPKAKQLIQEGHFAPGSMLPKMEAAVTFVERPKAKTIICNPQSLPQALQGTAGTIVKS